MSICGTCLLPNRPTSEVHSKSSIAIDHEHASVEDELRAGNPTKLDIFGPGLLLLKKRPIQSAMGIVEPIEAVSPDDVVRFLGHINTTLISPHIQILFLLGYHLLPTTAHSPDAPATSIHAAAQNNEITLPTRSTNKSYLDTLADKAADAAVATVKRAESLKPVSGLMMQQEWYGDGSVAKVTVEWSRTEPKEVPDKREMFDARCRTVVRYVDKMSENDARILFRILVREHAGNLWRCPCGGDDFFNVRTQPIHYNMR